MTCVGKTMLRAYVVAMPPAQAYHSRQCATKRFALLVLIVASYAVETAAENTGGFGEREGLVHKLKDSAPSVAECSELMASMGRLKGKGGGSDANLGVKGGSTGALFKGNVVRKFSSNQLLFGGGGIASDVPKDRSARLWPRSTGTFDCQNWSVVTTIYEMTPAIAGTTTVVDCAHAGGPSPQVRAQ